MKRLAAFVGVAASAVSLSQVRAETLRQFDLTCAGISNVESVINGKKERASTPANDIENIDLDKREFCEGDCRYVFSIKGFSSTEIMLRDDHTKARTEIFLIDRVSGQATRTIRDKWVNLFISYDCTAGPFTGLDLREKPKF